MTAQWVGEIVGKLHIARIAHKELAEQMGVTSVYVSMVLNGKRTPKGAEARFNAALDELLAAKEKNGHEKATNF